jgi:hypothetical protein
MATVDTKLAHVDVASSTFTTKLGDFPRRSLRALGSLCTLLLLLHLLRFLLLCVLLRIGAERDALLRHGEAAGGVGNPEVRLPWVHEELLVKVPRGHLQTHHHVLFLGIHGNDWDGRRALPFKVRKMIKSQEKFIPLEGARWSLSHLVCCGCTQAFLRHTLREVSLPPL